MNNYDQDQSYSHNTHSIIFEELAVVLSKHIDPPILKTLAEKLQYQLLAKTNAVDCTISIDDSALNEIDKSSNNKSLMNDNHDIVQAYRILEHMLATTVADASVLVAITDEESPKILLTRRASHLNAHAGEVSFAGGKHEQADGNNIVTALREACEETALPPNKVQIIGQLPIQHSKSGMSVRPIVALIEPDIIYVPELGEIERIFWADFRQLIEQPTVDYEYAYHLGENTMTVITPSWRVDNEVIWGLTGRIIASLLEIGFERETPWYYRPVSR